VGNQTGGFAVLVLAEAEGGLAQRIADNVRRLGAGNRCVTPAPGDDAERLVRDEPWDVILWQVNGPFPGLAGLQEIRLRQPDACILAVGCGDALGLAAQALSTGADGYLSAGSEMDVALEPVLAKALASAKARLRAAGEERRRAATAPWGVLPEVEVEGGRLAKLLELSMAMVAAETPAAVAEEGVRACREVFGSHWAVLHLVEPGSGELADALRGDEAGTARGLGGVDDDVNAWARALLRAQEGLAQTVLVAGEVATLAGTRVRDVTEALGALTVGWQGVRRVSDNEKRLLELVARHIGLALHRARATRKEALPSGEAGATAGDERDIEGRMRSLVQAAVIAAEMWELDKILAVLLDAGLRDIDVEEIRVYVADHEEEALRGAVVARAPETVEAFRDVVPLRSGASPLADAGVGEAAYVIAAMPAGDTTCDAALVPLRTRSALVGLLQAWNPASRRPVTQQSVRLLRTLGSLGAMVIDRARMDAVRESMARTVSHELRAPLSSVRAYTELVLDEGVGPINDEQRVFLQRVASSCEYLERLVEDLLDLSRLRAGEVSVRPAVVDLRTLVKQVVDRLRQRIMDGEIGLRIDLAPEISRLVVDPTRLSQILQNLVENAVKFNYRGGVVEIRAALEGGNVVIAVSDTGPGIAPDEQEAVFREFYRGRGEHAQPRTGAGLGLAISRRVARLLGGDLTLVSEPGRGSTFYLRLPFVSAEGTPEGVAKASGGSASGAGKRT
jgi:signal transduction histidine kinase